jgi:hypothetical protein
VLVVPTTAPAPAGVLPTVQQSVVVGQVRLSGMMAPLGRFCVAQVVPPLVVAITAP